MRDLLRAALLAAALTAAVPAAAPAETPLVVSESYRVLPPDNSGTQLFVLNKYPQGFQQFRPERTVLFVHGGLYPAESTFDLQLSGMSWMDFIAARGFDVYYVDLEGFGRATRPLAMSMAADLNAPVTSTEAAERQLEAAVSTILQRRKIDRLSIIGFDWGASVAARFASEKPNYVERLAMVAPPWVTAIAHPSAAPVPAGAYRTITAEEARQSWVGMAPASEQAALLPSLWFDAFWAANMAVDPIGAGKQPQVVRAPNGPALDHQRFWDQSRAPYDPAKITAAVLVVRGQWDTLSTDVGGRDLASRLIAAAGRSYVTVPGGTHYMMIERGRERLFNAVQQFLEAVGRS